MSDLLDDLFDLGSDSDLAEGRKEIVRAPFAMPGAKYRSAAEIIPKLELFPECTWVEVFGGTGVISWNIPDCKVMVYNDRYSGVYAFYAALRDHREELIDYLKKMPPHSREEWTHCKQKWVTTDDLVARAAQWFYMTKLSVIGKRQCFGRGIRSVFTPLWKSFPLFDQIHNQLRAFTLENADAFQLLQDYDTVDTVFYLDPPYLDTDQNTYEHKWKRSDMARLLDTIEHMKGRVVLSHYSDAQIASRQFWTSTHTWDVRTTSEPSAYREENNKTHRKGLEGDTAKEHLWIKDAK